MTDVVYMRMVAMPISSDNYPFIRKLNVHLRYLGGPHSAL